MANNASHCTININNVGSSGVQIAFVISTTITIIDVVLAYLLSALDDQQLNFLDRHVIARVQEKGRALKRRLVRSDGYLTRRESCTTQEDISQLWEVRHEAISRFILAVSDTQLVTGLAVLIAGIYGVFKDTISSYELHIIISQAWLSSTTHLATLDALRNRLRSYGIVRDIRVICMMLLLLLLTVAFGLLLSGQDTYANTMVSIGFHGIFQPWNGRAEIVGNTAWVAVLLLIWSSYIIRIQDLYVTQRHPMYIISALIWKFKRQSKQGQSHSEYFANALATLRLRRLNKVKRAKWLRPTLFEAEHAYNGAFLSSMPGIFFCFAYGATWNINIYAVIPRARDDCLKNGEIDFGQMMPLLLLLLPVFAVGATYYEYRNKLDRTLSRSSVGSAERDKTTQALQNQSNSCAPLTCYEQSLEEFESSINVTFVVCFFSFELFIMTFLAVLLNAGWYTESPRMMAAGCVFLFHFGIQMMWTIYQMVEWATI